MPDTATIVTNTAPPRPIHFGHIELPALREKWLREGVRWFRECAVPMFAEHAFRKTWKLHRPEFLERGFTLRQHDGKWFLQQWLVKTGSVYTLTDIGEAILAEARGDSTDLPFEEPSLTLDPLPAHLEAKLFDYQVEPARQILRAIRHGQAEWGYAGAWDCSDLGTGKTYQDLAAAIASDLEIGIICPLSVISAWRAAFAHFGFPARFIRNYESLRTGRRDYVKLERYQGDQGKPMKRFQWQLKPQDTILLFDEAHNVKKTGTLNQGLAMAAIRQGFPTIFISGTLAANPTQMRATGRVVGLHGGNLPWATFLERNGCTGKTKSGKDWKFCGGHRGKKILLNIHRTVFPSRGARTRIADLGDRFPDTQIMAEPFETGETEKIAAAFREAEYAIERLRQQGDHTEEQLKMIRQSAYLRAWHASERAKVPAIVELAHDEIEEGQSVALFVNFTDVREEIMKKMNTKCGIFGGQPPWQRDNCIRDFQQGLSRIIVCQIKAGGVGVSLHDTTGEYPRTAIILPTNNAVDLKQALGRVHRAGGQSKSRQIVLFAAGTVEEQICKQVRSTISNFDTLNDGVMYPEAKF